MGGEGEEGEDEAAGAAESLFKKWDRPTQPTRTPSPTHRTAHPWSAKRGAMERGLPTSDRAASILPSSLPPCSKTRKKSAQLTNQRGGVEAQGRVPEIALVRDAQPVIGRGVLVPAGGGDKRVQPSRNKRDDPLEKQIRQVAGDRPASALPSPSTLRERRVDGAQGPLPPHNLCEAFCRCWQLCVD